MNCIADSVADRRQDRAAAWRRKWPRVTGALPSAAEPGRSALHQAPHSPALPYASHFAFLAFSFTAAQPPSVRRAITVADAPPSSPTLTTAPFANQSRSQLYLNHPHRFHLATPPSVP